MIGQITYNGDGSTRIFPVSFEILGEDYVQVFINNIAISERTRYDIINNSIVFLEGYAPEIGTDNVVILVASSPTEIGDLNTPPSNIQSVLDNMTNINAIVSNKDNIDIVATNISSVNTISTNIQAVIDSYDNASTASTQAGIAATKAGEASISAGNALISEQNADISEASASISASNALTSENLAYKWSSNPKDEEVITGKYSAYHWSEKAKEFAAGSALNIAYNNTTSGLTAVNVQEAIDELASEKAEDTLVVHKDSTETITGVKTFNSNTIFNGNIGVGGTPVRKFHVKDTNSTVAAFETTSTSCFMSLNDDSGVATYLGTDDGKFKIQTSANSYSDKFVIDTIGNVLVVSPAGLGYGTGAGGTVTQITSKETNVTLNKPSGKITTNNSALGANTTTSFQVLNSLCTANDTVVASLVAGVSRYSIKAQPFDGGFYVYLSNITAGALSEALPINFTIIKGVTA